MIISASRRTDIPAYFAPWLLNRLREGYVLVRNPYNFRQVTKVSLDSSAVDCLVFWTKNPGPILPLLDEIEQLGHQYSFQFTLTPYAADLEQSLPDKPYLISLFQRLARRVGPDRLVWRYDPILFFPGFTPKDHVARFASLASQLQGFTHRCTISLLSLYPKCKKNLRDVGLIEVDEDALLACIARLREEAHAHGIVLDACADTFLQECCGLPPARCIDAPLVGLLRGQSVRLGRDPGQRPACRCTTSVDIGAYNSCAHGCRYCYANTSGKAVVLNRRQHDPASPLLIGRLTGEETITIKTSRNRGGIQQNLFAQFGRDEPNR